MAFDVWGLLLQAVNVLILVWLLSRVFWRPVAAAIATRQEAAKAMIATAQETQNKADHALDALNKSRKGMAAERAKVLAAAKATAETAAQALLADAQTKADALLAAAKTKIDEDTQTARKANESQAAELAIEIAATLLGGLNGPVAQAAFQAQLIAAITALPAADRAVLAATPAGLTIVSAQDIKADHGAITTAVQGALGSDVDLQFATDPDLIAGLELRSAHFVLHNSWQADLDQVRKAMKNAT